MHPIWDRALILLSFGLAFIASYATLNLAARIVVSPLASARRWLGAGALAMGIGIWSMHFVGMLAMRLPIDLRYDLTTTADSLVIAIATSAFALKMASMSSLSRWRLLWASVVMGMGIAGMHYTGMAAIRVEPAIQYDLVLVAVSLLIAIAASYGALWLAFRIGHGTFSPISARSLSAAAFMGLAIVGMHYTGMAAAGFSAHSICFGGVSLAGAWAASSITFSALAVLSVILLSALFTTRLDLNRMAYRQSLERAQADVSYLHFHDRLTGLGNRELFMTQLRQSMSALAARGGNLAVLVLDIDRLKAVNDAIGHEAGDALLVKVAARLTRCLAPADKLARGGGDEFLFLLHEVANVQDVALFGARLLAAAREPYRIGERDLYAHFSIGACLYPLHAASAEDLVSHADEAMYNAKRAGRDTLVFFNQLASVYTSERLQLEADLRTAVRDGQLELHYQPQVKVASGEVVGVEALMRWRHPVHGLIAPVRFIGLAEETGQIARIGEWALHEGCRQARAWEQAGRPLRVAVNLSAAQFRQVDLVLRVREALEAHQLRPELLELELTESTVMGNVEESVRTLDAVRSLGVLVAVDDFGTGYSSLSYLRRLPLGRLKIDRSFVADLGDNNQSDSIARAVVALGHGLNMQVIAEGVETLEQLECLRQLGCDEYQGFFCSKALPAAEIARFLADWQGQTQLPAVRSGSLAAAGGD